MSHRTAGILVVLGCLVLFAVSVVEMARRAGRFNEQAGFRLYHFDLVPSRTATAFGRDVQIDDETADDGSRLRVTYGDAVASFPVTRPPAPDLPDLGAYDEWAKLMGIYEVERTAEGLRPKPETRRVVLVARRTAAGRDPETWGIAEKNEWTFDFHELLPAGGFASTAYRWPRTPRWERELQKRVAAGDAASVALAAIPPLEERSWQYQAAMHVIPKLSVPRYRFQDTALNPHVLGWSLATGCLSVLGILGGVVLAAGGRGARLDVRGRSAGPVG